MKLGLHKNFDKVIDPRLCVGQYAIEVAKEVAEKLNWLDAPYESPDSILNQALGAYHVARVICMERCPCSKCKKSVDQLSRIELKLCKCALCEAHRK